MSFFNLPEDGVQDLDEVDGKRKRRSRTWKGNPNIERETETVEDTPPRARARTRREKESHRTRSRSVADKEISKGDALPRFRSRKNSPVESEGLTKENKKRIIAAVCIALVLIVAVIAFASSGNLDFDSSKEGPKLQVSHDGFLFNVVITSDESAHFNIHASFYGNLVMPNGNGFEVGNDWPISNHSGNHHEFISRDISIVRGKSVSLSVPFESSDNWECKFSIKQYDPSDINTLLVGNYG